MRETIRRRLLSGLLAFVLVLTMIPTALAAPADHVVINKVYGGSTDGAVSHSFIELYNPTDSAVDLSTYSVQYRSSASDPSHSGAWEKLDLTGSIPAKDYYLIRCAAVTAATSVAVPEGNQEWNIVLHNKGVSVALMDNQTLLDETVKGDLSGAAKPSGLVDLAAATGNDYSGGGVSDGDYAQLAPAYEGGGFAAAKGLQSKKKGVTRAGFADSDDTAADFSAVDYSKAVADAQLPHASVPAPAGFDAECLTVAPGSTTAELYLTWYAEDTTTDAKVKIGNVEVTAAVTPASAGKVSCRAVLTGLTPGTSYTYSVSNNGGAGWSKEYAYHCPAAGDFTFGYVGDPQINMNSASYLPNGNTWGGTNTTQGWQASVTAMAEAGVDFIVSVGDNTDTTSGKEEEYTAFFSPAELATIPYAPTVGNHDRNAMFSYHFSYPNAVAFAGVNETGTTGDRAAAETAANYYYLYNNALFVVLNDSAYPGSTAEAKVFIDTFENTFRAATTAFAGQYQWLFVQHHKSTESVAGHVADSDIQYYVEAGFETLMDKYGVDFVMAGHDHVYVRSYVMKDGKRTSIQGNNLNDVDGTIYLTANTASGLKYYSLAAASDRNDAYPYLANGDTGMKTYGPDNLAVGVATWSQTNTPGYTIVDVSATAVTFKSYCVDDTQTPIDVLRVTKNTAVQPAAGYNNGNSGLDVNLTGHYTSGSSSVLGGVMEIVQYNSATNWAYAVNGMDGVLTAIDMRGAGAAAAPAALDGNDISVKQYIADNVSGFNYGDMTSIAIAPDGGQLAVAIQEADFTKDGIVAVFDCGADGTLKYAGYVKVGNQPDMVTYTPDGARLLTANEGEPRLGYDNQTDPAGSVSIIDVKTLTANTVGFGKYDAPAEKAALLANNILLGIDNSGNILNPSADFEPEYIACSDTTAYVCLQEANAIAVLNLASGAYTGIYSCGFEDFSTTPVDLIRDGKYEAATYSDIVGARMPDGISAYTVGGVDYILISGEGDSRTWGSYSNELDKTIGSASKKTRFLDPARCAGLPGGKDVIFGSRSFTLLKVTAKGLEEVYDTGSDFERLTYQYNPAYFNVSNDDNGMDNRSSRKGPEPETVICGTVGSKTYAFIGLERTGGIMVYDITDPQNVSYVNYINSRNYSTVVGVDNSPEGLCFIPKRNLLLVGFEVSGDVGVYQLTAQTVTPGGSGSGSPSYTLTFQTNGGSVLAGLSGESGVTVDLTAYIPTRDGYTFDGWYTNSGLTTRVTSVRLTANVTVYAKWTAKSAAPAMPFADVADGAYYRDAVLWAVDKGVTSGTGAATFDPDGVCTRAQAVTFLWRASGSPAPKTTVMPLADVPAGSYYYSAVLWAVEQGIVNGTSAAAFSPDATCSRGQIVTMLWRAAGSKAAAAGNPFADVAGSEYYADAVAWAVAKGITAGTAANTFSPNADCTRAQIVTFLYRAVK